MSEQRAKLADVARAGKVDDIRAEFANRLLDEIVVPPESQVEAMMLVQRETDWPATPRHARDGAVRLNLVLCSPANSQEGESAFLRVRLKLAAGVRHAVDFAVGVRKERDSRIFFHCDGASWLWMPARCISRSGVASAARRALRTGADSNKQTAAKKSVMKAGGLRHRVHSGRISPLGSG